MILIRVVIVVVVWIDRSIRSRTFDINDDTIFRNLNILIAEDNKINQKVLVRILNRLQIHNIVVIENGQEAVDQVSNQSFDLILMDLHMPIMDGIESCNIITKMMTDAIVVFLTAHVSDVFENDCYDAGGVAYLTKPCNIDTISTCLRNLIITGKLILPFGKSK